MRSAIKWNHLKCHKPIERLGNKVRQIYIHGPRDPEDFAETAFLALVQHQQLHEGTVVPRILVP